MLATPAAQRAIAMHAFEQDLLRALGVEGCPEILLRPVMETLFRITDFPSTPPRLRKATAAAIRQIMARLPEEKSCEVCRWFAAIRSRAVEIPGSRLSTVN